MMKKRGLGLDFYLELLLAMFWKGSQLNLLRQLHRC